MSELEIIDASDPQVLDSITRAEIDVAIATAKRYPRSLKSFRDDVTTLATMDAETAASCYYSLRREGKTIQGPSVRLAELALVGWRNVRAGARIIGETTDGKRVSAVGVCHDLENNVLVAIQVDRRITRRDGSKYGDDMIMVTANAAASIGLRNAVFRVIPRALIEPVYERCKVVAAGNAKTLKERRETVFEKLGRLNPLITPERICSTIGRASIEDVTVDDVAHLIGLGTAIKDGQTSIDEAFPEISSDAPDASPAPPPKKARALSEKKRRALAEALNNAGAFDAAVHEHGVPPEWTAEDLDDLEKLAAGG